MSAAPPQAEVAAASSTSGFARKAGATVLLGVALLGAGALAPTAAHANPFNRGYGYGHVQMVPRGYVAPPYAYQRHNNTGNVVGGIIAGAIVGTAIGVIANQVASPPPVVVVQPGYQQPMTSDGGGDAVACDGQMHHFDGYGNVADGTGYYRLSVNGWGNCVASPAVRY